ncbi:MAG: alcohol dehydrogenase catalytic domain-containing protein [Lentilitoribacter sp.]
MKALVYTAEKTLEYLDFADPTPKDGEVLVKIESVGICGSDMHAFLGHDERRPAPLILGHEAAGTIMSGAQKGQRVTINPLVSCGKCEFCLQGRNNICENRQIISMPPREGGFAQMIAMPMSNLVPVPDHVALDHAALAEPLGCGWHAVQLAKKNSHKPIEECKALSIGGGAIGLGAALCLKAVGCKDITIVEPNEVRRNFVIDKTGLNAVAPDALEGVSNYDVIIDGVGINATRRSSSEQIKPGGTIVHIGLGDANDGLDIRRMTLQEITFIGSYTYTHQDFIDTAHAIFNGRLGDLSWIEQRPLSEGQKAFEDILAGQVAAPKIVLKP